MHTSTYLNYDFLYTQTSVDACVDKIHRIYISDLLNSLGTLNCVH